MAVSLQKNPISLLQEVSVSKFNRLPDYTFEEVKCQEFKCIVELCGLMKEVIARSKKQAKNLAAKAMLVELGILPKDSEAMDTSSSHNETEVSMSSKIQQLPLVYLSNSNKNPQFSNQSCSHCKCTLNKTSMEATNQIPREVTLSTNACSGSSSIPLQSSFNPLKNTISSSIHSFSQQKDSMLKIINSGCATLESKDLTDSNKSSSLVEADSTINFTKVKPVNPLNNLSFERKMNCPQIPGTSNNSTTILDTITDSTPVCDLDKSNPVSFLQECLFKSNIVPQYELVNIVELDSNDPTYFYEVIADNKSALGSGSTKKEAKANAALSLMDMLKIKYLENKKEEVIVEPDINAVGQLITFCQTNNIIGVPSYAVVDSQGDPHCKVFSIRCTVGSSSVDCSAKSKKAARNLCAKAMLDLLQEDINKHQVKTITFESRLEDKDINEKVWKKLDETGARYRAKINATLSKYPVKDYIHLFDNGFYGESNTLKLLKSWTRQQIYSLTEPDKMFKMIVEDLSMEYELSMLEAKKGVILNLYLKCNPKWCFMEMGSSVEEAQRKIFISVLEFFYLM